MKVYIFFDVPDRIQTRAPTCTYLTVMKQPESSGGSRHNTGYAAANHGLKSLFDSDIFIYERKVEVQHGVSCPPNDRR
jgi:hypothetical protein